MTGRTGYARARPEEWRSAQEAFADAVEQGLLIVVRNWQAYAKESPQEWETAQEVFAEAADRTPALCVALALGGAAR